MYLLDLADQGIRIANTFPLFRPLLFFHFPRIFSRLLLDIRLPFPTKSPFPPPFCPSLPSYDLAFSRSRMGLRIPQTGPPSISKVRSVLVLLNLNSGVDSFNRSAFPAPAFCVSPFPYNPTHELGITPPRHPVSKIPTFPFVHWVLPFCSWKKAVTSIPLFRALCLF